MDQLLSRQRLRILFLYNHCWQHEVDNWHKGMVPSHRMFGLIELRAMGHTCNIVEPPAFARRFILGRFWRFYQVLFLLRHQRDYDCVVATHEAAAWPALLIRRMGLVSKPVVVLSVALLHPRNNRGLRKIAWSWLIRKAGLIISYASRQAELTAVIFKVPRERSIFLHFGVDVEFFKPQSGDEPIKDSVISAGTNDGKDFPTLICALPSDLRLTIVTDSLNAALAKQAIREGQQISFWHDVPITKLREMYRHATLHVIPLRESEFSSGQTVLLENMALGKAVIISDTAATRDYVRDGSTAVVVPPGDSEKLREAIIKLLKDPSRRAYIGRTASSAVRSYFTTANFAQALERELHRVIGQSRN